MSRPKVLIFIDWFAPGYKAGGPTTSNVNIVAHLKDKFEFFVITADTDYNESEPYPGIKPDCWSTRDDCHVYYFSRGNLTFAAMKKAVGESGCNVWYINGIYSRYFSIYPLLLAKVMRPEKVVVSARGMLSPHAFANKTAAKRGYLAMAKILGLYKNVEFHATNIQEAEFIKNVIGHKAKTNPIENLPRKAPIHFNVACKDDNEVRLVSFARISPEKNTLYAIEALQQCQQNVVYHIYGQINSQSYWQQCERAIALLPENVTVEYKGTVSPSEMPDTYRDYHFLYLPSTGENFGHAILESLMNGKPVIICDKTPWRDLAGKEVGWDLSLESKSHFAKVIDECAVMPQYKYADMASKSYHFAKTVTENPEIKRKYIELFEI